MARRDQPGRLREIGRVRNLQTQVAEAAAARAVAGLSEAHAHRDRGAERLAQDHARWAATLAQPSIVLEFVGAWTAAVDLSRAELDLLNARVEDADDLQTERSEAWRAALARERQARQLERTARRRVARAREEALLAEAADRATQRGVGR